MTDQERALRRTHQNRRFDRQFQTLYRMAPVLRRPLERLRARGWWIVRLPLALLFIAGGFLAILPFLGLWMFPIGLLLLAIDLPMLQGPLSAAMVRGRRRWGLTRRNWRR